MNIIYIPDIYYNYKHKYHFFTTYSPIFYKYSDDSKLLKDRNIWQFRNLGENDRQQFILFNIKEIQDFWDGNKKIICEKIERIQNIDKISFFKNNLININAILVLEKRNRNNKFLGQTINLNNEQKKQILSKYYRDIQTNEVFVECNYNKEVENELRNKGFAKIIGAITYVLDNKILCEYIEVLETNNEDKELAKQIKESLIKRQKFIKANTLLKNELLKLKRIGIIKKFRMDDKEIFFITNKNKHYLVDRNTTKIYEKNKDEDRHICLVPLDSEFDSLPKSDLILTKIYYILLNIPYKS